MRIVIGLIATLIVVLVAGVAWFVLSTMLPEDDRAFVEAGGGGAAIVDSDARIRIIKLEGLIEELRSEISALRSEIRRLEETRAAPSEPLEGTIYDDGENAIAGDYASTVLIPDRRTLNQGLTVASPSFLEEFLGRPRETLSDACEPMTNPELSALLRRESVGPIDVNMLAPAVESLRSIFEEVGRTDRDLLDRVNTAGSLCVRQIRGSRGRTSTHAFGLAVDINIDGQLDVFGDGKTQLGLLIMKDFFLAEGWVWGAAYGREDSMHFEVSREQIETWRNAGRL
ncbi:MAG: M15 family metallopeptidase [Pseudomonadota bacterium]